MLVGILGLVWEGEEDGASGLIVASIMYGVDCMYLIDCKCRKIGRNISVEMEIEGNGKEEEWEQQSRRGGDKIRFMMLLS